MTNGATAAAVAAAIAQAVKASGAIVRVSPDAFSTLLARSTEPLIVIAEEGVFTKHLAYLMPYKGLIFYAKSKDPLPVPAGAEVIRADRIWIPG